LAVVIQELDHLYIEAKECSVLFQFSFSSIFFSINPRKKRSTAHLYIFLLWLLSFLLFIGFSINLNAASSAMVLLFIWSTCPLTSLQAFHLFMYCLSFVFLSFSAFPLFLQFTVVGSCLLLLELFFRMASSVVLSQSIIIHTDDKHEQDDGSVQFLMLCKLSECI
jgi:hypothetical protein